MLYYFLNNIQLLKTNYSDYRVEFSVSLSKSFSVTPQIAREWRAEQIEGMPVHPNLGGYVTDSLEWKQYVISADNEEENGKCPFQFNRQ